MWSYEAQKKGPTTLVPSMARKGRRSVLTMEAYSVFCNEMWCGAKVSFCLAFFWRLRARVSRISWGIKVLMWECHGLTYTRRRPLRSFASWLGGSKAPCVAAEAG